LRYREPLESDLRRLEEDCEFVLLGSVATPKYVEPLLAVLGSGCCSRRSLRGVGI
jgi:hypothetical protein